MIAPLFFTLAVLAAPFKPNRRLAAENAALRQQPTVLRIRCAGGSGSRTMITCSLSNCVDGFHRAKFSASHATLDPDRACSAAQGGTLSLSKAAIRLTQMMKAGDTF